MSSSPGLPRRRIRYAALGAAALLVTGTATVLAAQSAEAATTLRAAAAQAGLFFGTAVIPNRLPSFISSEFGQVTPENAMKPDAIATSSGGLQNTGAADTIVNFASGNGMVVRGHTMVWYSQAGALQGASQSTLNNFIGNSLTRWGNKVQYYDVVNEAFDDNNSGRRRSQWPLSLSRDANGDGDVLDAGDTDVIRESFRRAKQVVAQNGLSTKLCINDYDIEGLTVRGGARNNKAQALYETVRAYTQGSEKLIDCVGFQSHFNDNPNSIITNDLQANIQRFADLGVEVQLTELDIDDDLSNNDIGQGQAENYRKVVRACLNVAKCSGITTWGVADSESWRSSERGLLFTGGNGNYQKKAAYTAVLEELNKGRGTVPPSSPVVSSPPPSSPPPSSPAPSSSEPSSPVPSSPAASDTPQPTGGCSATTSVNAWNGGFVVNVKVTAGSAPINGWSVALTLPSGSAVTNSWSSTTSGNTGTVRFSNVSYNGRVGAGQTTEFGFQGTGTATGLSPVCTVS